MHWQWLVGPSAALLAAASTMAGLGQVGTVEDELSRVVVPLVAALLSPLLVAIVFLFKSLVAELTSSVAALNARMDSLERRVERGDHDEHERRIQP